MPQDLTIRETATIALGALLVGSGGVIAILSFLQFGPEMFLARTIAGLAGCF